MNTRVSILAVVWEVGPTDRYCKRCELMVCQPTLPGHEDTEAWGRRKVLLQVVFWEGCIEIVRDVKKGDVIWLKSKLTSLPSIPTVANSYYALTGRPRPQSQIRQTARLQWSSQTCQLGIIPQSLFTLLYRSLHPLSSAA